MKKNSHITRYAKCVNSAACWNTPKASTLWTAAGLPQPGHRDSCGGWTLGIAQHWFGHPKLKRQPGYTSLAAKPSQTPQIPLVLGDATHVIASRLKKGMPGWRPETTKNERERTPAELAAWLVELARRCEVSDER